MLFHQGKRSREAKTVIVQTYVQKPRGTTRKDLSPNHKNNWIIGRDQIQRHGAPVKGYNRKAELLQYSQRLRESAQSVKATPTTRPPLAPLNGCQPPPKVVFIQRCSSFKNPTCLGNYKFLHIKFLTSLMCFNSNKEKKKKKKRRNANVSSSNQFQTKASMKSSGIKCPNAAVCQFQVQDRWRFFTKLLGKLRKQRKTLH